MPDTHPGPAQAEQRLRVLLVDDHPLCRNLAQGFAERQGHHVTAVASGREALAALAHGRFDVILMDIAMPELDGIEATKIIRRRERETGTRTRIIAVTAFSAPETRAQCADAGMDAFLEKPLSGVALQQALVGREAPAPILIVDDNEAVRKALQSFLELSGYATITAEDGAVALTMLQTLPKPPSLILLDLMMPVMDGVELRQALLADAELAAIPVVVISAYGELIDPQSLSPTASFAKPFDPDALLAIVAEHCVATRPARSPRAQRQVAAHAS